MTAPDHGGHRTMFRFPLSDEWQAWQGQNAKPMSMKGFAAFLEDHIIDVLDTPGFDDLPEHMRKLVGAIGDARFAGPSALYQLATGLKVHEKSAVEEAINLASGEGELKFKAETRRQRWREAGRAELLPDRDPGVPARRPVADRGAAALSQDG